MIEGGGISSKESLLPPARPALYVHVPFCVVKCLYCDFYTVTDDRGCERYLEALAIELEQRAGGQVFDLLFVGGGTPTHLSPRHLTRLLELIRPYLPSDGPREWSVEANPESADCDRVQLLRTAGVTRVSIGVQSFDEKALRALGRPHGPQEAVAAYERVRAAGFDSVNLDLIHSRPEQTLCGWKHELDRAVELGPDHLSCYGLTFEPGTVLHAEREAGRVKGPDEEDELTFFCETLERLEEADYACYEVSNFARPGHRCLHHENTWKGGEYLGVGASAVSHLDGARIANPRSLRLYVDSILEGGEPPRTVEKMTGVERAREHLFLGLRLRDGLQIEAFGAQTGHDPRALFGQRLAWLEREGFLEETASGHLRLTDRGWPVLDAVLQEAMG